MSSSSCPVILLFGLAAGLCAAEPPKLAPNKIGPAVAEQTIRDLIKQLGDESFDKRQTADKRLEAVGMPARELLRHAAKENPDPEVRQRCERLLRVLELTLFREVRRFEGHGGGRMPWVSRVLVSPDGSVAVSAGMDDGLRTWDLKTGKQLLNFGQIQGNYWSLALSRDGRRVLASGDNHAARIYDVKTGKQVQEFLGHTASVWGAVLLPDGKRAVTGSWDGTIRVWDIETGQQIGAFRDVPDRVRCLALSPDGKLIAAGHFSTDDGPATVRIWDVEKSTQVRVFEGHTKPVVSVAFSADGKTLLSSSFDGTARLWEPATGRELGKLVGAPLKLEFAAFTPDAKHVFACGDGNNPTVRVWNVASGQQVVQSADTLSGFLCVAVLPDGRHCLTAGRDGVVRLWQWLRQP